MHAIEDHNLSLVAALEDEGVPVAFDPLNRSPIVSLAIDDPELPKALASAGIVTSARAGRMRVGFHLYNTTDDVEALVDAMNVGTAGRQLGR